MPDEVAVTAGINRYTPAAGYKAIGYRFTDVFVKHKDGWRVAAAGMRREATGTVRRRPRRGKSWITRRSGGVDG